MLTSGPDLFIHSRPQHREGRRSGLASVPTCNRSGGLTRKPLSIDLNWSIQFFIRQRVLVALSMKLSEYQDLYAKLSTAEDIDFLAENFGHDKELLLVIYTQRIVRETTKKFYRVKAQARRLAFMWQNGSSLLEIARKFEFPPILTALMVLEQRKISRKQFWKMINELDSVKDRRLRRELDDVNRADIVYSRRAAPASMPAVGGARRSSTRGSTLAPFSTRRRRTFGRNTTRRPTSCSTNRSKR